MEKNFHRIMEAFEHEEGSPLLDFCIETVKEGNEEHLGAAKQMLPSERHGK